MARNYAQIKSDIWKDHEFKNQLGVDAQWLYFVLLSQSNLNGAGVVPLQDRKWRKYTRDITAERIEAALEELQAYWYVLVDEDTEEVLIRTFIRNDGLWKQPNVLKSALRNANITMSDALKAVIWHEVDRLPLEELEPDREKRTREIIETLRPTLPGTLPEGFGEPPSVPYPAPFEEPEQATKATILPFTAPAQEKTQAKAVQDSLPAELLEGFTEGFPEPPGVGAGVGEGAGESLGKEEIPKTSSSARTSEPINAGHLTGWWIEQCPQRPPSRVIGQMSKQIKNLLDEGIDPEHIRNGITAWMAKNCGPSALAGFVNQVMNTKAPAAAGHRGGTRSDIPSHDFWDNITDEQKRNIL